MQTATRATPKAAGSAHSSPVAPLASPQSPTPTAGSVNLALSELGEGAPLPPAQRQRMESALGGDLSEVRVHTDERAARMASRHGALAVAEGRHVAFGSGQYRPGTPWGEALLAHELAHTRQQSSNAVGGSEATLEREATYAGFIAALRLFDPARAAHFSPPALSRGALKLQRCAPPDYSNLALLPSREEYERRGELTPRAFSLLPDSSAASAGFSLVTPTFGEPSAPDASPLESHPSPIPANFGDSTESMTPTHMLMRLSAMEAVLDRLGRFVEHEDLLSSDVRVANFMLTAASTRLAGGAPAFALITPLQDPRDLVPTEPVALSRAIVRSERVVDRTLQAMAELQSTRDQEQSIGGRMHALSEGRGQTYPVEGALASVDFVRRTYMDALTGMLTPRMVEDFNKAEQQHGELGPDLLRLKIQHYEQLSARVPGIEDSTNQISEWAVRLEAELNALMEEAPRVRMARETHSPEFVSLESRFIERADLIATSIEALGEWDTAVQAYEFLKGNSALWGFAGVDRIAMRLAQMKSAAYDGDTAYLKLLLRDHRQDPQLAEYYQSLESIVKWSQLLITLAITLVACVASAGVGMVAAAGVGAALGAAGVAEGSFLMVSTTFVARVGAEALAFTLISRGLSSLAPGMEPKSPFWVDFLWNFGLFAVLKGASGLISKSLAGAEGLVRAGQLTMLGRITNTLAQGVAAYGILQLYGLLRFSIEQGRSMTAEEVSEMSFQNVVMMVAMAFLMKPFEPMFESMNRFEALGRFRRAYGGQFAEIEARRNQIIAETNERLAANPQATPADLADLRAKAEAIDLDLQTLVQTVLDDPNVDPRIFAREAGELFGRFQETPLPELLRQSGLDATISLSPTGRQNSWAFSRGQADTLVSMLTRGSYEVVSDTRTSTGRVIEANVPGKGTVTFIEQPTSDRVDVPITEWEIESARARIANEQAAQGEPQGATRSRGLYQLAETPVQNVTKVARAARGLVVGLNAEGIRFESVRASGEVVGGRLVFEGFSAGTGDVRVPVEIAVVPELQASGTHGTDTGHARLVINPDGTGWKVRVEIDARLASDTDVQHNLRHELREAAGIIGDLIRDPNAALSAQYESGVFGPGDITTPTHHDNATALEFRDVFRQLEGTLRRYAEARRAAAERNGAAVPPELADEALVAMRRLDAWLESNGFAESATRSNKTRILLDIVGEPRGSALAEYVEGYGERTEGSVRRRAGLDRLTTPEREALSRALGPDLDAHLNDGVPASAIDPIRRALGFDIQTNEVRNLLRQLLRLHQVGRVSDAALVEVAQRLALMFETYGAAMQDRAALAVLRDRLRSDPQRALTLLDALERRVLEGKAEDFRKGVLKSGRSWGENMSQGQLEELLDDPDSGFQRYRHPSTGNLISEPGFRAGEPLNRGRPKNRKYVVPGARYPDIYGLDTGVGRNVALELKTPRYGDTVYSYFMTPDVMGNILREVGGSRSQLPGGTPEYLVVDIRATGQTEAQALQDVSRALRSYRGGDARGLFQGAQFMTGSVEAPVLSGVYAIP